MGKIGEREKHIFYTTNIASDMLSLEAQVMRSFAVHKWNVKALILAPAPACREKEYSNLKGHVIAQKLPAEKRKPWISNPIILQDSDKQIVKKEKTRDPIYKTEQAMHLMI
ncbi:hypothetical protein SADUNF_Sadunf02G0036700 [Salix dunnii]|uniref:Uncharacterized protein n=1 Tax=Salix dunnii TaxID=1413687 RepID=A0A835N5Y3_9ROSI|nr:hypothetical protein SADUNF_Sadunf02G0036700 [Salix dunnii]